jgi:hypothetical protein
MMAPRSVRNKIRWQFKQITDKLEGCERHLRNADELAQGEHPRLEAALPDLLKATEGLKNVMVTMRDSI